MREKKKSSHLVALFLLWGSVPCSYFLNSKPPSVREQPVLRVNTCKTSIKTYLRTFIERSILC